MEVLTQGLRTRDENGGLLDLRQCLQALRRRRSEPISVEDLERAVDCLAQPLGGCRNRLLEGDGGSKMP